MNAELISMNNMHLLGTKIFLLNGFDPIRLDAAAEFKILDNKKKQRFFI